MDLLPCPCGKIPNQLIIHEGSTCKWKLVAGNCCDEWFVEFKHEWTANEATIYELATEAWNESSRTLPPEVKEALEDITVLCAEGVEFMTRVELAQAIIKKLQSCQKYMEEV